MEISLTSEEEAVLKAFLQHHREIEDDEGFQAWYMQRFQDAESEINYKQALQLAQVWKRRYEEGFQAGTTYRRKNNHQTNGYVVPANGTTTEG